LVHAKHRTKKKKKKNKNKTYQMSNNADPPQASGEPKSNAREV